jgi:hypothetical protein
MNYFDGFVQFLKAAFSDNGTPSSSRVISGWLCISSMALIWFIVRHMVYMTADKLAIVVGALPYIIAALAGFTVAPYGINTLSNVFDRTKKIDQQNTTNINVG